MKPFAVIQTGGKQYLVEEGESIVVNKIEGKEKDVVTFESVLLYAVDENTTHIGAPLLPNVKVLATITEQGKGEKIRIARFRSKSRHRRLQGHREVLTKLSIQKIAVDKK
ncbi:MAG: 50S ribosomal protein L21 [Candidatus Roizmanbacteria bacterium]|nr:50S ribosomal protein L21 [Candidatus Roizmanbacteria bacterium]